jgi:hypothetical protein
MGEPKTVPTDANVHEFLDAATSARRREEGLRLAEIFGEVTGTDPVMWGPTMVGYGSFRYISRANPRTRGNWFKTGFSPRKAQLTFYGLKRPAGGHRASSEAGHLHGGRKLRLRQEARRHRSRGAAPADRDRVVAGR